MPNPPRFRFREIALLCLLALWVAAVVHVERTPPLTPPAVPYAKASR